MLKGAVIAVLVAVSFAAQAQDDVSKVNSSIHLTQPANDVETVNGSITIDDGISAKDVETVNGAISLRRNATVKDIENVNGSITLDEGAKAESIVTVNGALRLAEGAAVNGDVEAVNGSVRLARNVDIKGKLSNVNGKMEIEGAHVGGGLETTNGDIEIKTGSRIQGGLVVKRPSGISFNWGRKHVPKIVVGPGATVEGTLTFEHEVELYVSTRATIGRVEGATPIPFSGDSPGSADKKAADTKVEK